MANSNEVLVAKVLAEVFGMAADHHDESKPEVTHDLSALESRAKAVTVGGSGFGALLSELIHSPVIAPLLAGVFASLFKKLTAPKPPAEVPDAPVTGTTPTPNPQVPEAVVVAEAVLKLNTIVDRPRPGEEQKAVTYTVDDAGVIRRTDGVDALDDGSTVWLDLDVIGSDRRGMRIDKDPAATPAGETNHAELLGKQIYRAYNAADGSLIASIGGRGLGDLAHFENGASFVPNRYLESGGMAANLRIKVRFPSGVRIEAEISDVTTNSFQTPAVL